MRHIISISGKDSLATAILQTNLQPDLKYEFMFNDVGTELPETYEWLDKVEKTLGIYIHRIGKFLEDYIIEAGVLPSAKARFCTSKTKILPMEKWIGSDSATVYFGIRADEDRQPYRNEGKADIRAKYPLKEHGLGLIHVLQMVDKAGLQPPKFFWRRLHDMVRGRLRKIFTEGFGIGPDVDEYLNKVPRILFDQLFAWRTRTNCYFCFFQRKYEWVGLLEHHPELFAKARQIESSVGGANEDREEGFYWISGLPLGELEKRADAILKRQVIKVTRHLLGRKPIQRELPQLIQLVSCGLFCGK